MKTSQSKLNFADYYSCAPHPAVVKAVVSATEQSAQPYGESKLLDSATECLRHHFGRNSSVLFVTNGTVANSVALQSLCDNLFDAIICTDVAHTNNHEAGLMESRGHKLLQARSENGKMIKDSLWNFTDQRSNIHRAKPAVVTFSNATELGTVYTTDELNDLTRAARCAGIKVHIDGARLAQAYCGIPAAQRPIGMSYLTGNFNSLSLGATKNGGMLGDAVILSQHRLSEADWRLLKREGQLHARQHLIAAQLEALYGGDLWKDNALASVASAQEIARRCQTECGLTPLYPVEANMVFLRLTEQGITALGEYVHFHVDDFDPTVIRLVCSWNTPPESIDQLISALQHTLEYSQ